MSVTATFLDVVLLLVASRLRLRIMSDLPDKRCCCMDEAELGDYQDIPGPTLPKQAT